MRWGLLFSDILARILGGCGLFIPLVLLTNPAILNGPIDPYAQVVLGTCLFSLMMACLYLIPKIHDRVMAHTLRLLPRLFFVGLNAIWLALAILIYDAARELDRLPLPDLLNLPPTTLVAAAASIFFAVIVFPLGLGYEDAKEADLKAREDVIELAQAPKSKSRLMLHAQAEVPDAVILRARDPLDWALWTPAVVAVGAVIAARQLGTTVPSTELDALIETWMIHGIFASALLIFVPSVAGNILRAPASVRMYRLSKPSRMGLSLVTSVLGGAMLYFWGAQSLAPEVLTRWTNPPQATANFEVARLYSGLASERCVDLVAYGTGQSERTVCGLDGGLVAGLIPGDQLRATGPRGEFGHRLERIELLSAGS